VRGFQFPPATPVLCFPGSFLAHADRNATRPDAFWRGEPPEPDLRIARHSIDLMAVLLEKTKGNLTLDEQRLLENSLTELRSVFVQVSDRAAKAAAPKA